MADVASRALDLTKVIRGRISSISVGDGTDKKLTISGLDVELTAETFVETINETEVELENRAKVKRAVSREVEIVLSYSELDTTDLGTINDSTIEDLIIITTDGGANDTGVTITIDGADSIVGYADGLKTKIKATKVSTSMTTLPYTITDNAA